MSRTREIVFVVARASNGCIARDGKVPWSIGEDLRHFVRQTMGKPMVMGRKTFEGLPGVLPKRRHIVLTRDPAWRADGAEVAHSVADAFALVRYDDDFAVIGGADVFAQFEPFATRFEVTEIDEDTQDCEVFLRAPDPAIWREAGRESHPATGGHPPFAFVTYLRNPKCPAQEHM